MFILPTSQEATDVFGCPVFCFKNVDVACRAARRSRRGECHDCHGEALYSQRSGASKQQTIWSSVQARCDVNKAMQCSNAYNDFTFESVRRNESVRQCWMISIWLQLLRPYVLKSICAEKHLC